MFAHPSRYGLVQPILTAIVGEVAERNSTVRQGEVVADPAGQFRIGPAAKYLDVFHGQISELAARGLADAGCWMLDSRCWMLDAGISMLDAGY